MRLPNFVLATVVILSTIKQLVERKPLAASASTGIRKSGARVLSDVNGHTVTDAVLSNASSCTITAGRGFPT